MSIHTPSLYINHSKNISQSQNINNSIKQKIQNNLQKSQELTKLSNIDKQEIFRKLDETAKNILTKKPELVPKYKIHIDGIDFYFWAKIKNSDKQLFFVNKKGKIEPRVSRFSGSGQKMHIFPGYDTQIIQTSKWNYPRNKRYSKWDTIWQMDYESWVIADSRIEKILQNLTDEIEYIPGFWDFLALEWYLSKNYETTENLQEFEKINISTTINRNNLSFSLNNASIEFKKLTPEIKKKYQENPIKWMKHIFNNMVKLDEKIFEKFLENNKEFPEWTKYQKISNPNDEIQKYNIEVWEYNGKMLYVTFCYQKNEPQLCWVESFNIFGSPITTFGIPKHRVSGGIFTTKPAEYFSQIPEFLQENLKHKNPNINFYNNETYDIREYIQENPFIIAFKKLRQENPKIFE